MTADLAIINRVLDWVGASMGRIPHFYLFLGGAVGLLVLAVIVREFGRAFQAWRRK